MEAAAKQAATLASATTTSPGQRCASCRARWEEVKLDCPSSSTVLTSLARGACVPRCPGMLKGLPAGDTSLLDCWQERKAC